jgi:hypothetical protein
MKYRGESVLLYHLSEERYVKMQPILIRMGIRARIMEESQIHEKVGTLFKLPGFETISQEVENVEDAPQEEIMLMNGFSSNRLNEFLASMRKGGVGIISLKAIVTAENVNWKFIDLYRELSLEHQRFLEYKKEQENKRNCL